MSKISGPFWSAKWRGFDRAALLAGLAIGAGQLYFAVKADLKPAPALTPQTLTLEVKTKGDATVKVKIH